MKSKMYDSDVVQNKDRRFGSNDRYFAVKIVRNDGSEEDALFTDSQISQAIKRAVANPEDIPKKEFLFGIFG